MPDAIEHNGVEREEHSGAIHDGASEEGHHYDAWLAYQLGPDWVEVEPGIFRPPEDRPPGPEPVDEHESLDEALRPKRPEPEPEREEAEAPARRGWWRRR